VKGLTVYTLKTNKWIFILLLISSVTQIFIKGISGEALINIIFQFAISWILSYGATYLYSRPDKIPPGMDAKKKPSQLSLWFIIYLIMIILTVVTYFIFPEFRGFN
jgi:magnesium-transporting ATPase (P-type)